MSIGTLLAIHRTSKQLLRIPITVYSLSDMRRQKQRFELDGFTVYQDRTLDTYLKQHPQSN